MTTNVITRNVQINQLGLETLPEMAQDLVLSQPAMVQERVESRQNHVRTCLEQVQATLGRKDPAYSMFALVCELLGTGGHNDLGTQWGGETMRLPWFSTCGTGRRHAGDGPAWDDALRMVLHQLVQEYPDEEGSSNGRLTLRWDPEFKEVELVVRYSTTDEIAIIEELYSHDESWEIDTVKPVMELGLARSMRTLCGQLLVALTRGQDHLALTHNDIHLGTAHSGIAIDRESFKAPGALEAVGKGFEYWSHKI